MPPLPIAQASRRRVCIIYVFKQQQRRIIYGHSIPSACGHIRLNMSVMSNKQQTHQHPFAPMNTPSSCVTCHSRVTCHAPASKNLKNGVPSAAACCLLLLLLPPPPPPPPLQLTIPHTGTASSSLPHSNARSSLSLQSHRSHSVTHPTLFKPTPHPPPTLHALTSLHTQ